MVGIINVSDHTSAPCLSKLCDCSKRVRPSLLVALLVASLSVQARSYHLSGCRVLCPHPLERVPLSLGGWGRRRSTGGGVVGSGATVLLLELGLLGWHVSSREAGSCGRGVSSGRRLCGIGVVRLRGVVAGVWLSLLRRQGRGGTRGRRELLGWREGGP